MLFHLKKLLVTNPFKDTRAEYLAVRFLRHKIENGLSLFQLSLSCSPVRGFSRVGMNVETPEATAPANPVPILLLLLLG